MQTEMLEQQWEKLFIDYLSSPEQDQSDASHDLGHFRRVYHTAQCIVASECVAVDSMVILAAAYFHDIVSLPKNHPDNKMSSRYAALKAKEILQQISFPEEKIDLVCHAIEAHSFSAQLPPQTIEAKIIQDADRMEALGALGAMRTFYVSGRIGRPPFDPQDLYAERRPLDDKTYGFDHFYVKLFKLPEMLQTEGGRRIADKRVEFLRYFANELGKNIAEQTGGALVVIEACVDAGRHGLRLFDASDSWAEKRPLNPTDFVVDRLIKEREAFPKFLGDFLCQLMEEVRVVE